MADGRRAVKLRSERSGPDWRNLWASVDAEGNLHIDGQDLGPRTKIVSPDGEYEWFQTVQAADVPKLLELLGGAPETDVLDFLATHWSGNRSYELERLLRESDIEVSLHVI